MVIRIALLALLNLWLEVADCMLEHTVGFHIFLGHQTVNFMNLLGVLIGLLFNILSFQFYWIQGVHLYRGQRMPRGNIQSSMDPARNIHGWSFQYLLVAEGLWSFVGILRRRI